MPGLLRLTKGGSVRNFLGSAGGALDDAYEHSGSHDENAVDCVELASHYIKYPLWTHKAERLNAKRVSTGFMWVI